MSTQNINYSNLDSRYAKPSDVDGKIAAQAATDAAQYALSSPAPGLRRTRAKLAAIGTGASRSDSLRVAVIGTSIAAGNGADPATTSYPAWLRRIFESAGLADRGDIVKPHDANATDPRYVFMGNWSAEDYGPPANSWHIFLHASYTVGDTLTYTSTNSGTLVNIWYSNYADPVENTFSTFTVAIDGGTPVNVRTNGGQDASAGLYQIGGLPYGTHQVVVTVTNTVGVRIGAIQVQDQVAGVEVANLGFSGATTDALTLCETDTHADWEVLTFTLDALQPDLIIFNSMTNDPNNSVSTDTYGLALERLIAACQTRGIDLLLISEIDAQGTNLDAYRGVLQTKAQLRGIPVVDMFTRWGVETGNLTSPDALGMMSDGWHPNGYGYREYAVAVAEALGVKATSLPDAQNFAPQYYGANTSGTVTWQRVAVVNGLAAESGANIELLISGVGDYGVPQRGNALVSLSQRNDNGVGAKALWLTRPNDGPLVTDAFFYKQTGLYVFEIWLQTSTYSLSPTVTLLNSGNNAAVMMDSTTVVQPSGLVAIVPETVATTSPPAAVLYSNTPFNVVNSFTTVPVDLVTTDTANAFDTSTHIYTIPKTGLYTVTALLRTVDGAASPINVGMGIDVSNIDSPTFTWQSTSAALRNSFSYTRLAHFTQGDQARLFTYVDNGGGSLEFISSALSFLYNGDS